jgi:hypothetical protein
MSEELDRYDLVGRQRRELAGKMRRELADHDARESARQLRPRPAWRVELDDLLIANDAFWFGEGTNSGLISVRLGSVSDDDMRMIRAWFAGKCRICQRPMHKQDVRIGQCRDCGADNSGPQVVAGSVVTEHEIEGGKRVLEP